MTTSATEAYVVRSSEAELERLLTAARLLDPVAIAACRTAGLVTGGRAIDVGCGPLGALRALHEVVGEAGTVVGVDSNPDALGTAGRALSGLGISGVRLVQADANTLTPDVVGDSDFDLVFCRLLLMHQTDPGATLSRLTGLLRPGGSVVAYDFFSPPICEPAVPAVDRAWSLIIGAMRARGASPDASRNYPEHCAAAGLEVVSQRGVFLRVPYSVVRADTIGLLTGSRRVIESAGSATADEVDALLRELRDDGPEPERAYTPPTIELIARLAS